MDIDFPLILVVLVALTGAVVALDKWLLAPKRLARCALSDGTQTNLDTEALAALDQDLGREPAWVETSKSIFPVLAAVLILRSFLFEPFQIPSGSMKPTLQVGDFILVNKFSYGLRLPVLNTKVISINEPKRGDVMVFRYPHNPKINYIKRVVGLPGDVISYQGKNLFVNGELLSKRFVAQRSNAQIPYNLLEESMDTGMHQVREDLSPPDPRTQREWVVPAGQFFTMGDNRDHSNDSRYWGFVPEDNIVGKAVAIWMHWPNWGQLPSFKNNGSID